MVKILDRPSFGGQFGQALGTGLATGLSKRFDKLEQEQKQKKLRGDRSKALQELLGYEPAIAESIAALDDNTIRAIITQKLKTDSASDAAQVKQKTEDQALIDAMRAAGVDDERINQALPYIKQVPANERAAVIQSFAQAAQDDLNDADDDAAKAEKEDLKAKMAEAMALEDEVGTED